MGSSPSKPKPVANVYQNVRCLIPHKKDYAILGLDENDIGHLYGTFSAIDVDSSMEISLNELLDFIKAERTNFTEAIFKLFDKNNNKKIDSHEFMLSLWNFCTMSHNNIAMFVFELYDKDDSGYLEKKEMEHIIKDTYGAEYDNNTMAKKFLTKMEERGHKKMSAEYFVQLTKNNSAILYPAYILQSKMRADVVGDNFWNRLSSKREDMFGSGYVPVDIILRYGGNANDIETHYSDRERKRDMKRQILKEEAEAKAAEADMGVNIFPDKRRDSTSSASDRRRGSNESINAPTPQSTCAKTTSSKSSKSRRSSKGRVSPTN